MERSARSVAQYLQHIGRCSHLNFQACPYLLGVAQEVTGVVRREEPGVRAHRRGQDRRVLCVDEGRGSTNQRFGLLWPGLEESEIEKLLKCRAQRKEPSIAGYA